MTTHPDTLADDLLTDAGQIAAYIYGANIPSTRRRVYYAVERALIPVFRVGRQINARKSELRRALSATAGEAA